VDGQIVDAPNTAQRDCLALLERRLHSMPPVRALGLRIGGYDGQTLQLAAPLALNVNDKGSAFGGSLASLMTLACWGLSTLKLNEAGFDADVYVQDSQQTYLKPLYDELCVTAMLAPEPAQTWQAFVATFVARGKARATLVAEARDARGNVTTTMEGRFVALRTVNG
jgi:thioesterase domain-containing protein